MKFLDQFSHEVGGTLRNFLWLLTPRVPRMLDSWRSGLPKRTLLSIQAATFQFEWDGVRCIKNPFGLALYSMILSRLRPKTIVEIGSSAGGSGLWFGAQSKALGLGATVYSFDINPVLEKDTDNVFFGFGDVNALSDSPLPEILARCERPLLVVEDGPHTFDGCLAALQFFDKYLEPGDCIVIEDGVLRDLGYRRYRNGPNRAVKAFLGNRSSDYEVDRTYCDFWGRNFTWNINGFLRRTQ